MATYVLVCGVPLVFANAASALSGTWPEWWLVWRGVQFIFGTAAVTVLPALLLVASLLHWCGRRWVFSLPTTMVVGAILTGAAGATIFGWLWSFPSRDPWWAALQSLTTPEGVLMFGVFSIPGALFALLSALPRRASTTRNT